MKFSSIKMRMLQAKLNITNKTIERLVGKSNATVAGWKSGAREPKLKDIAKIAKALNCEESELFV